MDMEMSYYKGQKKIEEIQKLLKEVKDYCDYRPDETHKIIINRINTDLQALYNKLEF